MRKIILIMLLICSKLWAQNLLSNGSFDNNIDGWSTEGSVNATWISNDGNNQNGAIELKENNTNGAMSSISSEKVNVIAGKKYKFSGFGKVIGSSEARDAGIQVVFYNDINFAILTTEIEQVFNPEHDVWHQVEQEVTAPEGAISAEVRIGVITPNSSSSNVSIARWDDVRLELVSDTPNSFAMVAGHSALWYDPNQNGHGINVYMLKDQRILVIWYVYDNLGNPLWLLGVGTHDGFKATLDVTINTGAMFPPNFDANDINRVDWGKFELEFSSCTEGTFKWTPIAGNGFTAGQMPIKRVITTLGLGCNQ